MKIYSILILISFLICNFFLNIMCIWLRGYWRWRYYHRNLLEKGLSYASKIPKKYSFIEGCYLCCIYFCYYLVDILQNILRIWYSKKEERKCKIDYRSSVDILVCLYTCITVVLFVTRVSSGLISAYFIWRLFAIVISKLQIVSEIGLPGREHEVSSFNRILALTFLNFVELILGFSYLYFYFGVYPMIDLELVLNVLMIFVTLGISNAFTHICYIQKILLMLQIFTLIIFFIFFIANITGLKYRK